MMASTLDTTHQFVPIKYLISWAGGSRMVEGFAFETPGWPEFHACVRYGHRMWENIFDDWIIDQFETGLGVSTERLTCMEDAPAVLAKRLEEVGLDHVRKALWRYGL